MKTILIIDDDLLIRESLRDVLESQGFQTITAENGKTGLHLAAQCPLDLILCDVKMPEMDGYAVLQALRQMPTMQTIPFIFLTARADKLDLRQGMNLGADDYLNKPCTIEELLAALNSRLAKHEALQAQTQKELDQLRSSIALSLPHEFRTPLTGIFTSVELLRLAAEQRMGDAEIVSIADTIQSSAQRLYRLIQNYLMYSKLELAIRDPNAQAVDLDEITLEPKLALTSLATELAAKANRSADLRLNLQNAAIAISVFDLEKIITELLDNAIKFSPMHSLIEVSSAVKEDFFQIQVVDYGIGMTAAEIARLGAYMQFNRETLEQQGVGLGLAIARRLVQLRGGQLTIESVPHQMTTIQVVIPLATLD